MIHSDHRNGTLIGRLLSVIVALKVISFDGGVHEDNHTDKSWRRIFRLFYRPAAATSATTR